MNPIKILIADDHEMIRDGLYSLLENEPEIAVVSQAVNGEDVLQKIKALPELDIIIMDINMPVKDGIETTREIKSIYPEIKVLILSMYNRTEFIKSLVKAGADGYILKNSGKKELMEAIKSLSQGESYYGREVTKTVMSAFKDKEAVGHHTSIELSEREKEVIRLISSEMTTQEIAEQLFLSPHTIDSHRKNILAKLDVKNTAGIIKYALQSGIIKGFDL